MAERSSTLSVLIVTDPDAQASDDAMAISSALADVGYLVLGVRAGDASLPAAHRFLQDLAMKKGLKLRDAAERVIDVESLLG